MTPAHAPAGRAQAPQRHSHALGARIWSGRWLVVQVARTVFPAFDLPGWALARVILVLAIGFIPALIFAWVFELTPDGLKRDSEITPAQSITPQTARKMERMILVLLVMALAFFAVDKFVLAPGRQAVVVATANPVAAAKADSDSATAVDRPRIDPRSIAVLPFENLSQEADNAFFVSGMQDLILTNLSKIRDLKVISRSSMEKYASHPENLKVVGAELGVAHLLEGSVQRVGDQVLINLQLIEVATDSHLWAETYNRKIENVFEVEQEVANAVAKALHIQLTTPQAIAVRARQAANPQALDAFMRGEYAAMELGRRSARAKYVEAIEWYEKSIAADPNFALAYAQLARALMEAYYFGVMTKYSAAHLTARAERALATARRLQPDLPESDLALSFVQSRAQLDYAGSIATLDRVIAAWPGDPRAYLGKAANLRHLGRFEEALTLIDTALSLSPRDENLLYRRAQTLTWLRRFADAEAVYRQMVELFPRGVALVPLATLVLRRRGDLNEALALLPPDHAPATYWRAWLLARQGKFAQSLAVAESMEPRDAIDGFSKQSLLGRVHWLAGERDRAGALLRASANDIAGHIEAHPDDGNRDEWLLQAALNLAIVGEETVALALLARALEEPSVQTSAISRGWASEDAAHIHAMLGRVDLLLPVLARMREPTSTAWVSAFEMRDDPWFAKVRDDPRVQAEIALFAELER